MRQLPRLSLPDLQRHIFRSGDGEMVILGHHQAGDGLDVVDRLDGLAATDRPDLHEFVPIAADGKVIVGSQRHHGGRAAAGEEYLRRLKRRKIQIHIYFHASMIITKSSTGK